jgi:hypothetical protein
MKDAESNLSQQYASNQEVAGYRELAELYERSPIPKGERLANLPLFMTRASVSQLLFMHELYRRAVGVHGVVMELGVRWGRNLAVFEAMRAIYEPHNFSRKIIGFDTFDGFPSVAPEDGDATAVREGALSVSEGYQGYLENVLSAQEKLAPRPHLKKFELVKGDVTKTLPAYLEAHPETIVALAYFDMDLYAPTKVGLELIADRLTKGSVVGFDELALAEFPGETTAVREALGLRNVRIQRSPFSHYQSFLVVE